MTYQLADIARAVRSVIRGAEQEGRRITDGNVLGFLLTNMPRDISITDLQSALVVAGFAPRFPVSTRGR